MRLALTLTLSLLAPLGLAATDDSLHVYQFAGIVQCSTEPGVKAEQAADLLRGQGVKVVSAQRRKLPLSVAVRCGAPTGEVNVIEVPAADWALFTAQNADSGGYGIWVFERPTVEVYRYDGTLQCGLGKEIPPEVTAGELAAAQIEVLSSRKGKDGLDHIAVCGASTGAINVFTIAQKSLAAAERLGFEPLVTMELAEGIKPRTKPDEGPQGNASLQRLTAPAERIPLLW
jgi:hypothetical protein